MPLPLKQLESLLYRLITAPSGVAEGLAAERNLPPRGLDAIVCRDERLSAADRVDIYANMYFYRLLDVLKEDFPATLKVLGDTRFHNLVTGYLVEYPPTEPSVFYCGRYLADFLRDHPMRERAPFVADLAMLERALVESFHAEDAVALDAAAMRAIAPAKWPSLKLAIHPAVRILPLQWRVAATLRAVQDGRDVVPAEPTAHDVIVWRRDARVFFREIEPGEARALRAASRGATFGAMCDLVAAGLQHSSQQAAVAELNRLLARWLEDGILIAARASRSRRLKRAHAAGRGDG